MESLTELLPSNESNFNIHSKKKTPSSFKHLLLFIYLLFICFVNRLFFLPQTMFPKQKILKFIFGDSVSTDLPKKK